MSKFGHFITYNNLVPITISVVLLGSSATYAYQNPEVIYERTEQVVAIDNTYIATVDFDTFSPSVEILTVTEDSESYYVRYRFATIELVDSVWQNVVSIEELEISKANLGTYRDLGLYVTEELRELVLAEEKRLRETQVFERQQVTHKQVAIEYSGIIGGRLSPEIETLADYDPLITPPAAQPEPTTLAGPDARSTVSTPITTTAAPPPASVPPRAIEETFITPGTATGTVPATSSAPVATTTPTTTESADSGSSSGAHTAGSKPTGSTSSTPHSTATSSTSTTSPSADEVPSPAVATSTTGIAGAATSTTTPRAPAIPQLTLLGDALVMLTVGDTYTDLGIITTDSADGDLTTTVAVNGTIVNKVTLDTSKPTEYEIVYTVENAAGGSASMSRIVRVLAPEPRDATSPPTAVESTDSATTSTARADTGADTSVHDTTPTSAEPEPAPTVTDTAEPESTPAVSTETPASSQPTDVTSVE